MKTKITRNQLFNANIPVIKLGYCDAQTLLRGHDAIYYNSGVYGWNYDVYLITCADELVFICTGYNPIGNIKPDYELTREYELKAQKYCYENGFKDSYYVYYQTLDNLLSEYINKVLAAENN